MVTDNTDDIQTFILLFDGDEKNRDRLQTFEQIWPMMKYIVSSEELGVVRKVWISSTISVR
jgi:hypothetical protein